MAFPTDEIYISAAILDITAIDLTLAGQIELMQFSHEAIIFANKRMLNTPIKDNPFAYFKKLCHIWHQENNVATAPNIPEEIFKLHGISSSEAKLNSNGRAPHSTLEIPKKTGNASYGPAGKQEFTRKQVERHYENTHTDEEYKAVREYHAKTRPHEYVTTSDGRLERKAPRLTLEEELALPLERREQEIAKLDADWESPNGEAFKKLVGRKTALDLYGRLRMQLMTGKLWPDAPIKPEKEPQSSQNNPEKQPSIGAERNSYQIEYEKNKLKGTRLLEEYLRPIEEAKNKGEAAAQKSHEKAEIHP